MIIVLKLHNIRLSNWSAASCEAAKVPLCGVL